MNHVTSQAFPFRCEIHDLTFIEFFFTSLIECIPQRCEGQTAGLVSLKNGSGVWSRRYVLGRIARDYVGSERIPDEI
jgi:hypothetical protein